MAGSDGSHADIEWRFAESIFSATQGTAHVISIYLERLGRSVGRFAESQNREDTPVHGATYMSYALLTKYLSCKMYLADAAIFALPFINMRFVCIATTRPNSLIGLNYSVYLLTFIITLRFSNFVTEP